MPEPRRQLDAEDFEQPADLVLDVDALGEHRFTAREQCADVVTLEAFDVHFAVPAGA